MLIISGALGPIHYITLKSFCNGIGGWDQVENMFWDMVAGMEVDKVADMVTDMLTDKKNQHRY